MPAVERARGGTVRAGGTKGDTEDGDEDDEDAVGGDMELAPDSVRLRRAGVACSVGCVGACISADEFEGVRVTALGGGVSNVTVADESDEDAGSDWRLAESGDTRSSSAASAKSTDEDDDAPPNPPFHCAAS